MTTTEYPRGATAMRGKGAFVASLQRSFGNFETFEYAKEFVGDEGHVLEFRGSVGHAALTGMDIIRLDAAGKVSDPVVMVRPVSDMKKCGEEAAR
ncbi:hypothetical protein R5H30_19845 [Sulfitobacter sp. D35]|uniref:hypothetical protein n=1 Tax=Sulfitobacter sp. D35 TaxID=3083252 RepID=UPI00296EAEA1|nr:hypothetical protein [Sulfitobacter sp. D35]MDW4500250.1 hypothetical protein [Sulfitobacter sp. D35]